MKRILKISSMFIVLVCVFMLFACSDDTKNTPVEATQQQKELVAGVVVDFTADDNTLATNFLAKAMTARPARTDYSANGITVKYEYSDEDEVYLTLTYSDYKLSNGNGIVNGNLSLDSSVPSLEGNLTLSEYDSAFDGEYAIQVTKGTDSSENTGPVVKITKDESVITFDYSYIPLLLDVSRGFVNALLSDYTIRGDGITVSMKASMSFTDGKATFDISSLSYDIDNIRSPKNTYSFYLSGRGTLTADLSAFNNIAEGETPALCKILSGSLSLNSAELKVGNDTLSVDGFTLDISGLMSAIDESVSDPTSGALAAYLSDILNSIIFRINGQAIDISTLAPLPQIQQN